MCDLSVLTIGSFTKILCQMGGLNNVHLFSRSGGREAQDPGAGRCEGPLSGLQAAAICLYAHMASQYLYVCRAAEPWCFLLLQGHNPSVGPHPHELI